MDTKALSYNELQAKARSVTALIMQAEKEKKKASKAVFSAIDVCPTDIKLGDFAPYLEAQVKYNFWADQKHQLEITVIRESLAVEEIFEITVAGTIMPNYEIYNITKFATKLTPSQANAIRYEMSRACNGLQVGSLITVKISQHGGFISLTTQITKGTGSSIVLEIDSYSHCIITKRGKKS